MSAVATARYHVTGMDCASCAAKIEGAARKVSGVTDHLAHDDRDALRIVRRIVGTLGPRTEPPWQVARGCSRSGRSSA